MASKRTPSVDGHHDKERGKTVRSEGSLSAHHPPPLEAKPAPLETQQQQPPPSGKEGLPVPDTQRPGVAPDSAGGHRPSSRHTAEGPVQNKEESSATAHPPQPPSPPAAAEFSVEQAQVFKQAELQQQQQQHRSRADERRQQQQQPEQQQQPHVHSDAAQQQQRPESANQRLLESIHGGNQHAVAAHQDGRSPTVSGRLEVDVGDRHVLVMPHSSVAPQQQQQQRPIVAAAAAPEEGARLETPVVINIIRTAECAFMMGISQFPAGPFAQNALLTVRYTNESFVVYGVAVSGGPPIAIVEIKISLSPMGVPVLLILDKLPESQSVGVGEGGPWFSKTEFIRAEVPFDVPVPLYMSGQGRLGSLVMGYQVNPGSHPDGSPTPALLQPPTAPPGQTPPTQKRSLIHTLIKQFNPRKFLIGMLAVVAAVSLYLVYEVYMRRKHAQALGRTGRPRPAAMRVSISDVANALADDDAEDEDDGDATPGATEAAERRGPTKHKITNPKELADDDEDSQSTTSSAAAAREEALGRRRARKRAKVRSQQRPSKRAVTTTTRASRGGGGGGVVRTGTIHHNSSKQALPDHLSSGDDDQA